MPNSLLPNRERAVTDARELLIRLCRQPSVAAQHLGMAEMASLTETVLRESGFTTRRLAIDGAPPIIYGEQIGRGPFTLLLYNHYDVQPTEPDDLWHSPPFEPTIRNGNLYARGASDNKGEFAARLAALRALRDQQGDLPITVRWVIEGEEEIGSVHFGEIIAPHAGLLQADGVLWEGCGFTPDGRPECSLGFKGVLYVQLEVRMLSRDAHSGTAPIFHSAAWRLHAALGHIRATDGHVRIPGFYDAIRPPTQGQLDALRDPAGWQEGAAEHYGLSEFLDGLTGPALGERYSFAPTCNIAGLLAGYTGEGVKTVLPAQAMAKIDFRLVPDQDPERILADLRAHLDAGGFSDVSVTQLISSPPVVTPFEEPFAQRMIAIAETVSGRRPVITPLGGGSLPLLADLRRVVGVPGLSAPGNPFYVGGNAHSPNEHIRLSDLEQAVEFNYRLFSKLD